MSISFSVVIPTKSRPEPLARTLESLWATQPRPDEVLVIDADEQSSAREVVVGLQDGTLPIHYIHTEPSLTKQRNIGIDRATGDVVVFLDDDVSLPSDLFAKLGAGVRDPSVAGATGWVVEPHRERRGGPRSWARRFTVPGSGSHRGSFTRYGYPRYVLPGDGPCDVEFMPGCFMSARRELASTRAVRRELGALRARRGRGLLLSALAARPARLPARLDRRAREARLPLVRLARLRQARGQEPQPTSSGRTSRRRRARGSGSACCCGCWSGTGC